MSDGTDVALLGGEPAGYMAALVAAHRGAPITLVEEQRVVGTWLNARCIPTKSVTTAADALALCRRAGDFCLSVPQVDADFPMLNAYRPRSIHQLVPGVEFLLGWRGITAVAGEGRLVRLGLVSVFAAGKISEIPVCRIFLVPGSIAAEPPIEGGGLPGVTTSAEALSGGSRAGAAGGHWGRRDCAGIWVRLRDPWKPVYSSGDDLNITARRYGRGDRRTRAINPSASRHGASNRSKRTRDCARGGGA